MEKITAQMVFDLAWQKFIVEQAPPAVIYDTKCNAYVCCYLTNDGKKCAIGLSIPDGHEIQYSGQNLYGLVDYFPELFDMKDTELIIQCRLHDGLINSFNGKWDRTLEERKQKYKECAELLNLTIPGE